MPERLECEVLQKERYINTLTLPLPPSSTVYASVGQSGRLRIMFSVCPFVCPSVRLLRIL